MRKMKRGAGQLLCFVVKHWLDVVLLITDLIVVEVQCGECLCEISEWI